MHRCSIKVVHHPSAQMAVIVQSNMPVSNFVMVYTMHTGITVVKVYILHTTEALASHA
jgi:hypothetical protein